MVTKEKIKHPIGLQLCNIAIAIQSLYSYGILGFLILFFTAGVSKGGLGLDEGQAAVIFGYYTAFGYMMTLIGGFLADKYLGLQKSIILGTTFSVLGYISLYFSTSELWTVFLSLLLLLLASGLGKGNISALVGALYSRDQVTMKDAAYSIFYMAVNIGALLGPLIFGTVTDVWFSKVNGSGEIEMFGYRYGFLAAIIFSLLQLIIFVFLAPKWLKEAGKYPVASSKDKHAKATNVPLTKIDLHRMIAMAIMFIFSVLFWSAWNQTQTSFTILAQKGVDRTIFGWTIPTPWLMSFNGLLCAILAPILGGFWVKLSKTKRGDLSTGTKMGIGMILSGIAFGVMILGLNTIGGKVGGDAKMALIWILLTYVLLTVGELFLSPIGMSMFNKLAPAKYASIAMGVWYLSFSLANIISGYLAKLTVKLNPTQVFTYIGLTVFIFGVLLILITKFLNKLMHLDKLEEEAKAIEEAEETLA